MRDMIERAWRTAAECAARADEATDLEIREFFIKRRDAWISAANRLELLGFAEEHHAGIERDHAPRPGLH
jgi:hypothetical protein